MRPRHLIVCGVGLCVCAQAAYAVLFAQREDLNLLNCYNATVSASHTGGVGWGPNNLRGNGDSGWWETGSIGAGVNAYLTFDFGAVRNLQTIRMSQYNGYQISAAQIQTSADGITYGAALSHSFADTAGKTTMVLDSAVDTRYVRITGTGYADAGHRWIVHNARAFGSAGSLDAVDLDLISGSALADGDGNVGTPPVALSFVGSVSITDTTIAEYVDDAVAPIKRQVLYNIGNGEGAQLSFDQPFAFSGFGYFAAYANAATQWQLQISGDGSTWGAPVLTGSLSNTLNLFSFAPTPGQYVRFTFTANAPGSGLNDYISDLMLFGSVVPEPATAGLLAAGVLLLRRRR